MAIIATETFEAGTNGATISTSNSSADAVTVGANNTQTFDNTYTADPEIYRLKVVLGTTNASLSEFQFTVQAGRVVARVENFRFDLAQSSWRPLVFRNNSSANMVSLAVNGTTGLVSLVSNSATVSGSNSTTVLAADTDYDLELAVTKGTTTSDGVCEYRIYAAGSSSALETRTFTGQNTETIDARAIRLGSGNVASAAQTWWCDNLQVQDLASGWIGPTVLPPILSFVTSYSYAVLDARGSTAQAGGSLSYTISPSIGVIEPVDGLFLIPRGGSDTVYTVTVTESGSGLTDNTPTETILTASANDGYTILVHNGTSFV